MVSPRGHSSIASQQHHVVCTIVWTNHAGQNFSHDQHRLRGPGKIGIPRQLLPTFGWSKVGRREAKPHTSPSRQRDPFAPAKHPRISETPLAKLSRQRLSPSGLSEMFISFHFVCGHKSRTPKTRKPASHRHFRHFSPFWPTT